MRRAGLLACVLALAACEAPTTGTAAAPATEAPPVAPFVLPPVEGFAHEAEADLSGFYLPASEVRIGDLRLSHLFIGDEAAFQAWEASEGRGPDNFPPIMLQFDDLASETIANDLGGQTPSVVVRVLPTGFGVSSRVVRLHAVEPRLGEVVFEGEFVQPAFDAARRAGGTDAPVLRGTLTIDGRIFEGQAFAWTRGN